jgi:hypothetical protein
MIKDSIGDIMQINNKEYKILTDAWDIINNLDNDLVEDYEKYLSNGNPPDVELERKMSTVTKIGHELRKFLQDVNVIG